MADLTMLIIPAAIMGFLLSGLKKVNEHERAQIYRLGRYAGIKGPGLFWIVPFIDKAIIVDAATALDYEQKIGLSNSTDFNKPINP
ncbi:MAG: hypothetical protein GPJ54_03685 [Candidatus Heimdallarchaeota archaeon]|nr:hypothetical protein [Candidatus Heimdallarchaeota archaeon]